MLPDKRTGRPNRCMRRLCNAHSQNAVATVTCRATAAVPSCQRVHTYLELIRVNDGVRAVQEASGQDSLQLVAALPLAHRSLELLAARPVHGAAGTSPGCQHAGARQALIPCLAIPRERSTHDASCGPHGASRRQMCTRWVGPAHLQGCKCVTGAYMGAHGRALTHACRCTHLNFSFQMLTLDDRMSSFRASLLMDLRAAVRLKSLLTCKGGVGLGERGSGG